MVVGTEGGEREERKLRKVFVKKDVSEPNGDKRSSTDGRDRSRRSKISRSCKIETGALACGSHGIFDA